MMSPYETMSGPPISTISAVSVAASAAATRHASTSATAIGCALTDTHLGPTRRRRTSTTDTGLRKVALDGGASVAVCPTPPVSRGASCADDDNIYFTPSFTSSVQRVPAAGGRPRAVTTLDLAAKEANHVFPNVLPGGKGLLFTA
jgi:hypothetical protein